MSTPLSTQPNKGGGGTKRLVGEVGVGGVGVVWEGVRVWVVGEGKGGHGQQGCMGAEDVWKGTKRGPPPQSHPILSPCPQVPVPVLSFSKEGLTPENVHANGGAGQMSRHHQHTGHMSNSPGPCAHAHATVIHGHYQPSLPHATCICMREYKMFW